jgi:cation transport ATPase
MSKNEQKMNNETEQNPEQTQSPVSDKVENTEQKTEEKKTAKAKSTEQKSKSLKEMYDNTPRWAKVVVALLIMLGIYKWTPIFQLVTAFLYIVLLPAFFLYLMGFISNEAYDSLLEGIDSIKIKIQEQKAKEQNV